MNEFEKEERQRQLLNEIINQIEAKRWHVISVSGDAEEVSFAYSVGLYTNFNHPEIIVFGISPESALRVINRIGAQVKEENMRFIPEMYYDEILVDYRATFLPVPKNEYDGRFNIAAWYYDGFNFPALQLVWPDKNDLFPWEEGYSDEFAKFQPLLG